MSSIVIGSTCILGFDSGAVFMCMQHASIRKSG
jgi:hypothetical protein